MGFGRKYFRLRGAFCPRGGTTARSSPATPGRHCRSRWSASLFHWCWPGFLPWSWTFRRGCHARWYHFSSSSQTLPIIAIAPLMIIWFGFGLLPKVLVIALATFFPMTIGLIEGFAAADREAGALLRSMGSTRWQEFRYVRLPSAIPRFFTALRIGITYAVVGAVFSEYVGATSGLGIYMSTQKNSFRTDLVLAAVLVTALISVTLYLLTFAIERIVAPWAMNERSRT